jgi:alanyl-tRNA synthetase
MKSADIREAFLKFFKDQGHTIVSSSSLVPADDPTLLFTNAGMVQFKNTFLGLEKRAYNRAVSAQRCVRAGGKHNDLENVGYTARHHTFFEMLGNFSFGDYFKREAIQYAWRFLTEILAISPQKLWITVFEEDDEAANIWLNEIKIDPKRFSRCGEKDNFWAMGDTGPCGPCTEIFYDHGPEIAGGPPGSPDADGDRYIEIWNLVFMQYNREANGKIKLLPKPSVDTGMGLERISAVMQGVHNNYEIDLFQHLIAAIAQLADTHDLTQTSLRVIADHIRSAAFLIIDGVIPSNEGRGYVLRRIIRRAIRHGHKLGLRKPFFYLLVSPLNKEMGSAYPELAKTQAQIEKILLREEELFAVTLEQGLKVFESEIIGLPEKTIPGSVIFRLYDTYGFPVDLTADIARERGFLIDDVGFHQEMELQRQRSLAASKFSIEYPTATFDDQATDFIGYEKIAEDSSIVILTKEGQAVEQIQKGDDAIVVLKQTPFYPEAGGQIGDCGEFIANNAIFSVQDTQRQGQTILHYGQLTTGILKLGDKVQAKVNKERRQATAFNHSSTHLLNAALRQLLGDHVLQKGSLVAPERLRFDFSHFEPLTVKQIQAIERLVNEQIRANHKVETKIMTPEEAMDSGAIALFGEKYGAEVRVLRMGDFSMELCGGTHVQRTGDIGLFKIISETGIASGIRRIEAVTGEYAVRWLLKAETEWQTAADLLKSNRDSVLEKLQQLLAEHHSLTKENSLLQLKLAHNAADELLAQAEIFEDIKVLVKQVEFTDAKVLREVLDRLKQKLPKAVILLASIITPEKINLIAGVSASLTKKYHAGELIEYVANQLEGKGGGRPDMAQGAGSRVVDLPKALNSVMEWVKAR